MRIFQKASLPVFHPYLTNKYTCWYYDIIASARQREIVGYCERHHIIPRCMGGSDCETNIVKLTAREHFVCHVLLTKMVDDQTILSKLAFAAWQQSRSAKYHGVRITSRSYNTLRKLLSESYKGRKRKPFTEAAKQNMRLAAATRKKPEMTEEWLHTLRETAARRRGTKLTEEHKQKCSAALKGRVLTAEHKEKVRLSKLGKPRSAEVVEKIIATKKKNNKPNSMQGRKHSTESKTKMSNAKKGKSCPTLQKAIECITTGEKFSSIQSAAEKYNIPRSYISSVLTGLQTNTRGLVFRYFTP